MLWVPTLKIFTAQPVILRNNPSKLPKFNMTDIARSSYADMLHDTERNQLYYKAIKIAVMEMHQRGKKANVLDIGTGTGLLSMMAATAGADSITAIEVFEPMANVAKLVTAANGFQHIKIINKHSTEVSVGPEEDMKERANILITELFDTELIGEGALEAYHHAHTNLMEEDCIAVPHSATTYAQLVESALMSSWHALRPIKIENREGRVTYIHPDPKMKECPGVPAVHDIQLSQMPESQFIKLSYPVETFHFEWGSRKLTPKPRENKVDFEAIASGKAQVVLSWWTLSMDQKGEIILSTAPVWSHPHPDNMQWRDHWIQSVYFLPNEFHVTQGDLVSMRAYHDAYSMWFDAKVSDSASSQSTEILRPVCEYLPRMLWSRPRLGMLNDKARNATFVDALNRVGVGNYTEHMALCVSDVSLLPLLITQTCFTKGHVYCVETDHIGQRGLQKLVEHNELSNSITVVNRFPPEAEGGKFEEKSINLLVGEPFYTASLLPWHDLRFWYIRSDLKDYLADDATIMPCKAHLHVAAVEFENLWKIRAPVGKVEGFDVSVMDEMITNAMKVEEYNEPEPHSLWEYPCRLLSEPKRVMSFDFTQCVATEDMTTDGSISLNNFSDKLSYNDVGLTHCHAVVLWMTYDLDERNNLSTGLLNRDIKQDPKWNMHYKQGVFFLRKPIDLEQHKIQKIDFELTFIPALGEMKMKFNREEE